MHELSIATNLVTLAADAVSGAVTNGGPPPRIEAVRVRIGDLAGVVVEALEFAWDVASEATPCQGARLEIERVPARVFCTPCDVEVEPARSGSFRCPRCETPSPHVTAGRELELFALELADPDEPNTPDSPATRSETAHAAAHP